jgi:hypothetical protein
MAACVPDVEAVLCMHKHTHAHSHEGYSASIAGCGALMHLISHHTQALEQADRQALRQARASTHALPAGARS